jgi:hypothetical protein
MKLVQALQELVHVLELAMAWQQRQQRWQQQHWQQQSTYTGTPTTHLQHASSQLCCLFTHGC